MMHRGLSIGVDPSSFGVIPLLGPIHLQPGSCFDDPAPP